jgi:cytochrome c oxidase cbb3-type subunit 1
VERLDPKTLFTAVRRHSLAWLVAANFVGLWLAALLLWPQLGEALAPLTYGRWMPLHLDWQLYGWCALPLVGALLNYYVGGGEKSNRASRVALWAWTLALAFGGLMWLRGDTSGKLFLDWTGSTRVVWSLALLTLWFALFAAAWSRRHEIAGWAHALLAALFAVPFALYRATTPEIYPAINPHSGGPTGASQLGSTLGTIAVFGVLPRLLRLPALGANRTRWKFVAVFSASLALYVGINHGDASHHQLDQIIGVGSLLLWIPVVVGYTRAFAWREGSAPWLRAAFVWWTLLVVTGWLTFLPGISERLKFTNALVAHSHLAMAGLVTSLHAAILFNLPGRWSPPRWSFWLWQAACALHIGSLLWLGWAEGNDASILYVRGGLADVCYGLRFLAGLAMLAASIAWLRAAWTTNESN